MPTKKCEEQANSAPKKTTLITEFMQIEDPWCLLNRRKESIDHSNRESNSVLHSEVLLNFTLKFTLAISTRKVVIPDVRFAVQNI